MLAIKNNLMAANAARLVNNSYETLARSVERLSSGQRINSSRDDAAGLAVRELFRADIATMRMGARNARDGISMLQTMEGGMEAIGNALIRLKQLAEQAATGSYSPGQRRIMDAEFAQMIYELDRVANRTEFNSVKMLNEPNKAVNIHSHKSDLYIEKVDVTMAGLGLTPDFDDTPIGGTPFNASLVYGESLDTEYERATSYETFTPTTYAITEPTYTIAFSDYHDSSEAVTIMARFVDTGLGAAESWFAIPIVTPERRGLTVEEVVESINAQLGYTAAARVYDSTREEYVLQLTAQSPTANRFTEHLFIYDVQDKREIHIRTQQAAMTAMQAVTEAMEKLNTARADFGAHSGRLDGENRMLTIAAENALTSESRISDVDYATQVAHLTRAQVLAQAGLSVLAQANGMPNMAMQLLR